MMLLMSLVFTVLFVGCLVSGVFPLFLAGWIVCLFWLKVKRKWLWGLASVPVYLVLVVIVLVGGGFYVTRPAGVYRDTFGSPPPAGVTDIESSAWVMGDSGDVYLRFKVNSPALVQTLTPGYTPKGVSTVAMTYGNAPSWWTPPVGCDVYVDDRSKLGFGSEERVIYHDRVGGEVYFHFVGID